MKALPQLFSARFSLICEPRDETRDLPRCETRGASRRIIPLLLEAAARLALSSEVRVLDGGNCFNVYTVAQTLRLYTHEVEAALSRIQVARTFTCYQTATLLQTTPASAIPTLVLDLLATFQDQSVPQVERQRLLAGNIAELRRLSRQGPVLVSVHPKPTAPDAKWLQMLEAAADRVWRLETAPPAAAIRLF